VIITYLLLIFSTIAFLLSAAVLIRGIFYRPKLKKISLIIAQRIDHPNQWFTLFLKRKWYLRWNPLPVYKAGQSIAIYAPSTQQKRRYSLARWVSMPRFYQVTVKREESGKVSNQLWLEAKQGQSLDVSPPSGEFLLKPARSIAFIAGGVGVTPLLAMLDQLLDAKSYQGDIYFFWQVRHPEEWIYEQELTQLAVLHPQLKLHLLASQHSINPQRMDIEFLQKQLVDLTQFDFYICAGQGLLDSLLTGLSAASVPSAQIHFERFSVAMAGETGSWFISLDDKKIHFQGHSHILDALEEAKVNISADCRAGSCGQCQCQLIQGNLKYLIEPEYKTASGFFLSCCAVPLEDLSISISNGPSVH
jgi:ferredoxin-NADP reductase